MITPVRGAEEGAGQGIRSLGDVGQMAQMVQMVHPLATLALISGAAIVGAVMAHDTDEVNATEVELRQALSEARPQEQFADMVAAAAARLSQPPQVRRARSDADLERLVVTDPITIGNTSVGATSFGVLLASAWTLVPEEDEASTLLETGLPELTLTGERGFDPDVSLFVEASVRLLDAKDRALLWQRSYVYRSPPVDFFELGQNDAAKLKEMLHRGLAKLAFAASFDVFAARHPEVHPDPMHWSSVPPDEVWAIRRTATRLPPPITLPTSLTTSLPGTLAIASAVNTPAAASRCCSP